MEPVVPRRNSWLACPNCGNKVARARYCDIEFKCKGCGFEFEVIIRALLAGPSPSPATSISENRRT